VSSEALEKAYKELGTIKRQLDDLIEDIPLVFQEFIIYTVDVQKSLRAVIRTIRDIEESEN